MQETGEQRESVTFVECEAWNRTAESIFEYFKKGDPILIEGTLRFDSWQTDDGQNRNRLKIRINDGNSCGSVLTTIARPGQRHPNRVMLNRKRKLRVMRNLHSNQSIDLGKVNKLPSHTQEFQMRKSFEKVITLYKKIRSRKALDLHQRARKAIRSDRRETSGTCIKHSK